jgi:hypothetical protein
VGRPPLKNPLILFAFAVSSLFIGAAFIYISVKAPFFWGGAYLPGVFLLIVFAVTVVAGTIGILRKPMPAQ